jgi:hypothetical protein
MGGPFRFSTSLGMPAASGFFCFSFSRAPPTEGRCKVAARALPGDRRDMLTINVKHNVSDAITRLDDLQKKHVPFAAALALTRTAQEVRKAEVEEMKRAFDRPTPFTLRSLYLKPATKADLTARIWFKDINRPEHYLVAQITGGERPLKRFEQHLQRAGVLPKDQFVVPGAGARLNKYGNMSAGQITQILSATGAHPDIHAHSLDERNRSRRRGRKLRAYFVGRPGGRLPLGIWEKRGNRVLPVLIFVRKPHYSKRFRFYEIGRSVAQREFPKQFERALAEALSRR